MQDAQAVSNPQFVAAEQTRVWGWIYIALVCIVLAPVVIFDIPAMQDYPNHLARMYVLSASDHHPALNNFYELDWNFYPNLAMDLIVPAMARVMGADLATRTFLLLSLVLVLTGSAALERAVKGHFGFGAFIGLIFAYNSIFCYGFINFIFGIGAALWGITAWIALRERAATIRIAVHIAAVPLLSLAHLYGLGAYGLVVLACELQRIVERRVPPVRAITDLAVLGFPCLLMAMLLAAISIHQEGNGGLNVSWAFGVKWRMLATFTGGYDPVQSVVKGMALLALAGWLWHRGSLGITRTGIWVASALALAYLAMPSALLDTAFADVRIPVVAVFVLPAWLTWRGSDALGARVATVVCAAVLAANLGLVTAFWADLQQDYREMRASFAQLGPGSRVLVGWASTPEAANGPGRADKAYIARSAVSRALTHAPTLAVSDAGALVPTFFASPGKQIVRWRPAYRTFIGQDAPVSERALLEEALGPPPAHAPETAAPYWRDWTHNFDYLCLLMPEDEPNPLPQVLQAAFAGRRFTLYRIHPQP